jgi:hypothetical protein
LKYDTLKNKKRKSSHKNSKTKPDVIDPQEVLPQNSDIWKKYRIIELQDPNQAEPDPYWVLAEPRVPPWKVPDHEGFNNVFGLKMFLFKKEVALKFDLSQTRIEAQMRAIANEFPFEMYEADNSPAPLVFEDLSKLFLYICLEDEDWTKFKQKKLSTKNKPNTPRIHCSNFNEDEVIVIFDLNYVFRPQWDISKKILKDLQKPLQIPERRCRSSAWSTHLRVLDAKDSGATLLEIGKHIFNFKEKEIRTGQAQKAIENAEKVRDDLPFSGF